MDKKQFGTMVACSSSFVSAAVVNNYVPLLFTLFRDAFGLSVAQITSLIMCNFVTQIIISLVAARIIDALGYRAATVLGQALAAFGFVMLAVLPGLLPITDGLNAPYFAIAASVVIYAGGGGISNITVNPIIGGLEFDHEGDANRVRSVIFSVYCWGFVCVVLLSSLFFRLFGLQRWQLLTIIWAIVPLATALMFTRVRLNVKIDKNTETTAVPLGALLRQRAFIVLLITMVSVGASEQSMSQWASLFAETSLGIPKTQGDIIGPCMFAITMGAARVVYSKVSVGKLELYIRLSGVLCAGSYIIAAFAPWPLLALFGCALCGFSVGATWPGVISMASARFKEGGTSMFASFALMGSSGCAIGPAIVGAASSAFGTMQSGFIIAAAFPVVLATGVYYLFRRRY